MDRTKSSTSEEGEELIFLRVFLGAGFLSGNADTPDIRILEIGYERWVDEWIGA